MNPRTTLLFLLSSSLLVGGATSAFAQDGGSVHHDEMTAIDDALEIALGGSFAIGAGDVAGDVDAGDLAGPGGGAELQVGYRFTPSFAFGIYGTVQAYADGDGEAYRQTDVVSTTAGLEADWHFRPRSTIDPWVSLGAGLRKTWIVDQQRDGTDNLAGVELARLQVGVDYRLTPGFSIGPVIAANATMYIGERTRQMDALEEIDDKGVSWTFSAGLVGRFDAFGRRER